MQKEAAIFQSAPGIFGSGHLPELNFNYIKNSTDATGIIRPAPSGTSKGKGYCIDDQALALLWSVLGYKNKKNGIALPLLPVYLSFIHDMQTDKGRFKEFMSFSKICSEEEGSEESFGRTIMALGYLINEGPSNVLIRTGTEIFFKAYPRIDKLHSLPGIAYSIIGVCQFIKYNYPDDQKSDLVLTLSGKIMTGYRENKRPAWHWFEPLLTHENAILPLALLNAYEITSDESYLSTAFEAMHFLESKVFYNGMLSPVPNKGLPEQGTGFLKSAQQGIDAMAMVLLYQQAFRVTRDEEYLTKMYGCYQWFLGHNDPGLPLYDPFTGGCADGLKRNGVNAHQGARSTLAYWISHLVVDSALSE